MLQPLKTKGSVLIIALVIMSVVATISTAILLQARVEIKQADQFSISDQMDLALQGYQYWAIQTLLKYHPKDKIRPLAFKTQQFEKGAIISGTWEDQQGLFNINALKGDKDITGGFLNLLQALIPDLESSQALFLMKNIKDYLSDMGKMLSISELRSIDGISQDIFLRLSPYITALPNTEHKININAINFKDPRVLLSLTPSLTLEEAKRMRLCVPSEGVKEKNCPEFITCVLGRKIKIKQENLVCSSRYFLAIGSVEMSQKKQALYTLLERNSSAERKKEWVRLIWQSLNVR
jgi:type II secretory pathway component PulK